jgi:hypothetical protein
MSIGSGIAVLGIWAGAAYAASTGTPEAVGFAALATLFVAMAS